jgi:hypothetical protein
VRGLLSFLFFTVKDIPTGCWHEDDSLAKWIAMNSLMRDMKGNIKRRAESEAELVDHATSNLLRALKRDIMEKDGHVDREKLRTNGYSDHLLNRLEMT